YEETKLTASAGIAPNKLIAKIASDWNKPNGQLEVKPEEVDGFMRGLPVAKLNGVGKKGQETLAKLSVSTCGDLQRFSKIELAEKLGRWGLELFERSRGRDDREVSIDRTRKSLSKERTFSENIDDLDWLMNVLRKLRIEVEESVLRKSDQDVKSRVVKLKFDDFTQTTAETAGSEMEESVYEDLLRLAWSRGEGKPVRLLGVGVRFASEDDQMSLL
ncbi:MAG: DNA polymerase IV, partial [Akkermansiaceae bacterium]|nr:DNA polymerase IV [Akkermansiaceae bacterium]